MASVNGELRLVIMEALAIHSIMYRWQELHRYTNNGAVCIKLLLSYKLLREPAEFIN